MTPIRLAIVHPEIETFDEYSGGALARWTAEITRRTPADFEISVITKPARKSPYAGIRAQVVPVRSSILDRIPGAAPYAIHWFFPEVRRHLLRTPYDLVHVHARPQWILPLREAGLKAPIILHLQNDHLGFWTSDMLAPLLDQTSLVLSCSDFISRRVAGVEPTRPRPSGSVSEKQLAKIRTLRNGVDVERFSPLAMPRDTTGGIRVAYLGRIVPEKAPHLTMHAVLQLRGEGCAVEMHLFGAHDFGSHADTPYIRSLQEIANRDPEAFRFHGYVHHQQLPDALRTCDLYAHACTWDEPFALATAEAMACGLVPIVSRRGANLEVCGDAGLSFEPVDPPEGLISHIRRLIRDPALRMNLGATARRRAVDLFSWDQIAVEYFEDLRRLTADMPRLGARS